MGSQEAAGGSGELSWGRGGKSLQAAFREDGCCGHKLRAGAPVRAVRVRKPVLEWTLLSKGRDSGKTECQRNMRS